MEHCRDGCADDGAFLPIEIKINLTWPLKLPKKAIDSPEGRARYGRRFATVEPVFGNIRYNKGLDRFTLRGQTKVDIYARRGTQWKLFCLVHNIEKLAHHGYAVAEHGK